MANQPIGNETIYVVGVSRGSLASKTESFTVVQISGAAFTATRIISSGTSDTASASDHLIAWNSASASAKTETIPSPTLIGDTYVIKDAYGNAATYNITITPVSGTIDNASSYVLNSNLQSVTIVANGSSNWMVV